MARLRRSSHLFWPLLILTATLTLLVIGASVPSSSPPSDPDPEGAAPTGPMTALVPFDAFPEDLQEGAGVAVDSEGTIFVADRKAGVIYQYKPTKSNPADHAVAMPFAGVTQLKAPVGLWLEEEGSLLVADEGRGQVWRLWELNMGAELVAEGLKKPRWLVRGEDSGGILYITAEGLLEQGGLAGVARRQGSVLLRLPADRANVEILLAGLRSPQGLAVPAGPILPVAVEGFQQSGEAEGSAILGVRLDLGLESQDYTQVLLGGGVLQPGGLARDVLGALWLAADQWRDPVRPSSPPVRGVVAKVLPGGGVSVLVRGADSPQGLAFGPRGHLYAAERSRLLRFHAPDPPHLSPEPPAYTKRATLQLTGTALPGALINARTDSETATAQTDPQTGVFSFSNALQLKANRENTGEAFATSLAGYGLTSAPAAFRVLHDDVEPTVSARTDPAGPYLRGQVRLIAEAQDPAPDGGTASGLAHLTLRLLDAGPTEVIRTAAEGAGTPDPLMASRFLESSSLPDGPYTIEANAEDYAGNRARMSLPRTLDNTPPTLGILGVSNGATIRGTLQVEVVSADATSGLDRVELALDGRPALSSGEAPLHAAFDTRLLASGPHTLLARATDRAGNEATTMVPFTVTNLTVHLVSPASGTSVPSGTVLVQGTVETSAPEVGVVVNDVLAQVHGGTFAALVSVTPETASLTAHATTAAGATATHSVAITVVPTLEPAMVLLRSPQSGVAPLTVAFSLLGGPVPTQVELDFDGNGTVDFTGPSLEGRSFTYPQPGLYVPRVTLTDARGTRLTASAVVQVFDPTTLEGLLQAKWQGMKDALRRGDSEGVLQTVAVGIRTRYRPALETLRGDLPALAATLGDLQVISFQDGLAEAATVRLEDGQRRVYFIYFAPDDDGIWRILGM